MSWQSSLETVAGRALIEHRQAPTLYAELMALPSDARRRAVARKPRFASLALAAHLLAESRHRDGPEAEEHARLALAVVEVLPPERHPEALVWDLTGHAYRTLVGARLRRHDLSGAEQALAVAEAALELSTGDPLELARHLEQVAALRRQQGRRFVAHMLLRDARKLYLEIGDEQAAAALGLASLPRHRGGLRQDDSTGRGKPFFTLDLQGFLHGDPTFPRRGPGGPSQGPRRFFFTSPAREGRPHREGSMP